MMKRTVGGLLWAASLVGAWFVGHRLIGRGALDDPEPRPRYVAASAPAPEPPPQPPAAPPPPAPPLDQTVERLRRRFEEARALIQQARERQRRLDDQLDERLRTAQETPLSDSERAEVIAYVATRLELAFTALELGRYDTCVELSREILRVDADYPVAHALKATARRLRADPSGRPDALARLAEWRAQTPFAEWAAFKVPSALRWTWIGRRGDPAAAPDTLELYDVRARVGADEAAGRALALEIKRSVAPESWGREGRSLEFYAGALIGTTSPDVHEEIRAYLDVGP
jgi:hypothetical protein